MRLTDAELDEIVAKSWRPIDLQQIVNEPLEFYRLVIDERMDLFRKTAVSLKREIDRKRI